MKKAYIYLILISIVIVIMLVIKAQPANHFRPLATDFPRGALVFAQFSDLPGMLQSWNSSDLKERYLASNNYHQFTNRHLGQKLIERFSEFSSAIGFDLESTFLEELSQKQAAIALYDIGRLEFVFLASLDRNKFLVSKLIKSKSKFEEIRLKSGINYFVMSMEVDRGRQTQQLSFALQEDRFILTNNEQLMIRTLNNLTNKATTKDVDRLSSEPTYQILSKKLDYHYITVWVAQEKLNKDFYFRNYWIMNNIVELKDIKAAMFDIELRDSLWHEKRLFLTKSNLSTNEIPISEMQRLYNSIPQTFPYFKIDSIKNDKNLSLSIHNYFFDNDLGAEPVIHKTSFHNYYSNTFQSEPEDFYNSYTENFYLYDDYAKNINDPVDADDIEITPKNSYRDSKKVLQDIQQILNAAQPQIITKLEKPEAIDSPLFAEFYKAFIITLEKPEQFNKISFETAMAKLASDSTMIAGNNVALFWQDLKAKQGRVLAMPMLGWQLYYKLKDHDLILSNSSDLLKELPNEKAAFQKLPFLPFATSKSLTNITVIKLSERKAAFDNIFSKLQVQSMDDYQETHADAKNDFFVSNISSLLDTVSPIDTITITRNFNPGELQENVYLRLKKP